MRSGELAMIVCLLAVLGAAAVTGWSNSVQMPDGPNMCAVEEVADSPDIRFFPSCVSTDSELSCGKHALLLTTQTRNSNYFDQTCKMTLNAEVWGKPTLVRFECCDGYERVEGEPGCAGLKPWKDLLGTAIDLGLTGYTSMIEEAGLDKILREKGAFTWFVPVADSVATLRREKRPANSHLYQLVVHRVFSSEFGANGLTATLYSGKKLRLNRYANGVLTVNCARVIKPDRQASNGVVHVIERALDAASTHQTVLVTLDKSPRFSRFSAILATSGLSPMLAGDGPITVFTPVDEAFRRIPDNVLRHILNDAAAAKAFIQTHVVANMVCGAAIVGPVQLPNQHGGTIDIVRRADDVIYVGDGRITNADLVAENGVVHGISAAMVPTEVKSVLENADDLGLSRFREYIALANLEGPLEAMGIYTLFIPTNKAWDEFGVDIMTLLKVDRAQLRKLLLYHMVSGRLSTSSMISNQLAPSLDGFNSLRLQVYRKEAAEGLGFSVESGVILRADTESRNGVVQVIDRVLQPPRLTVMRLLAQPRFSMFNRLVNMSTPQLGATLQREKTMTMFLPTDGAFKSMSKSMLATFASSSTNATKVVKNHILDRMMLTSSLMEGIQYHVPTMEGNLLNVTAISNVISINNALLDKSQNNIVTKNGIIHVIDKVLIPNL